MSGLNYGKRALTACMTLELRKMTASRMTNYPNSKHRRMGSGLTIKWLRTTFIACVLGTLAAVPASPLWAADLPTMVTELATVTRERSFQL